MAKIKEISIKIFGDHIGIYFTDDGTKRTRMKDYSLDRDTFDAFYSSITKIKETIDNGGKGICSQCNLPIMTNQKYYQVNDSLVHRQCLIKYFESHDVKIQNRLECLEA